MKEIEYITYWRGEDGDIAFETAENKENAEAKYQAITKGNNRVSCAIVDASTGLPVKIQSARRATALFESDVDTHFDEVAMPLIIASRPTAAVITPSSDLVLDKRLFDRVFGNCVLFRSIFKSMRQINYSDQQHVFYDPLSSYARHYAAIDSVEWMLKNNHLNLFLYKLKNHGQDNLVFNQRSLEMICLKFNDIVRFRPLYDQLDGQVIFKNKVCLNAAIAGGCLDVVRLLYVDDPHEFPLEVAAAHGHHHIFNYLEKLGEVMRPPSYGYYGSRMLDVITNGHEDMLKRLLESGQYRGRFVASVQAACKRGSMSMLRELEKHEKTIQTKERWSYTRGVIESAVSPTNPLEMIEWAANKFPQQSMLWHSIAARHGRRDVLDWVVSKNLVSSTDTISAQTLIHAAVGGHLEVLKWLVHRIPGTTVPVSVLEGAASNNRFEILKYLHTEWGVQLTSAAFSNAINNGYLDIAEYIVENRDPAIPFVLLDRVCKRPPNSRVMSILQKAKVPINHIMAKFAIHNIDLAGLEWIVANLPKTTTIQNIFSVDVMKMACQGERLHLFKYMYECAGGVVDKQFLDLAIKHHDVELIDYLLVSLKVKPTLEAYGFAIKGGDVQILKKVIDQDKEAFLKDTKLMDKVGEAVRLGQLQMIKYLHDIIPSRDWTSAPIMMGARFGQLSIVKFLWCYRTEGGAKNIISNSKESQMSISQYIFDKREDKRKHISLVEVPAEEEQQPTINKPIVAVERPRKRQK
eukprot:gene16134-19197_t